MDHIKGEDYISPDQVRELDAAELAEQINSVSFFLNSWSTSSIEPNNNSSQAIAESLTGSP
jgi:hypothetical protein